MPKVAGEVIQFNIDNFPRFEPEMGGGKSNANPSIMGNVVNDQENTMGFDITGVVISHISY